MSISKIRENARVALAGKWGKGACIVLAYLAFFMVIGFILGILIESLGEESIVVSLIDLTTSIIQVPIIFGLSYSFIKLKRNEEVKAFDFLNLGFSNFGRAWKIGLREVLKMILPLIGMVFGLIVFLGASVFSMAADASVAEPSIGVVLIGFILYVGSIIWLAVRSLLYSLTVYIAFDNPNMSSLEVVNESEKMMRGNRGKIFLLSLSFIGWAFLAVFTLGIGYLWLMPYMVVAEVCFYEYLLGKKDNNNDDNNVDAITEM